MEKAVNVPHFFVSYKAAAENNLLENDAPLFESEKFSQPLGRIYSLSSIDKATTIALLDEKK